ncbi:MAG: PAS domain-containing sensor histidine kinase, partial [Pseudomonadota bacterium]
YRDYVETASDWVWEMGPDLRFTYFSDRIRDIAGIEPKALVGRRRDEISAVDDPENWQRHLDDLAARRPFRNFRYPLRRPDGTRIHISISGKPVFNQRGVFQGYRGVGTNVTAMVEAEQRTREAQRLAESASRTKSEFLANVSHELRTPLNAILGYSDVMRNRIFGPVENERYREYVEYIHESGVHLLQLINDVLDVSAIEAGKLELNESDCPIPALVDAAVRMIRTRAENKGLTLAVDLPAGLPALRADERRMKQILINLLSNAVKFTKAPATVRIEAGIAPNGDVRIAVADEGIGMTAEDVEKALQPFGRTRGGIAVADEGTGLGLPLARALTEAHGGTLTVDTAPGRGTTVTLRFPSFRAVAPFDATLIT